MTGTDRTGVLLDRPEDPEPGIPIEDRPTAAVGGGPVDAPAWPGVLAAGVVYLVLSVAVWWEVWSTHPTATTTCGCGDSSLFTWFLDWPAYALAHGLDPLYSTALFHPSGVNLLANTGEVGLGVVLAPVTWAFGVIATLNVAITLSPALSALALFVLVRRWVAWWPAAFLAGLLYGFSPFVLVSLTDAHLMLGFVPVPPLIVLCLDELLVRQRWRPVTVGLSLGALAAIQFFVGTEVLAMMAVAAGIGALLLLGYGLYRRELLAARLGYAVRGAVWALGSTVVLLAGPMWFALAGPAHLSGGIWGDRAPISFEGLTLRGYVWPLPPSSVTTALQHHFGGYQAPTPSVQYLGLGLLAVLAVGLAVWHRDLRLWLFAAVGIVATVLARGLEAHRWTPWRLLWRLPQLNNLIPGRFVLITYLCAAVMLAIIADHTRVAVSRAMASRVSGTRRMGTRVLPTLAGLAVLVVAVAPLAAQLLPYLPFRAVPVVVPQWFRTEPARLPPHQVVLAFPPPFAFRQSAMTWQAVNGMRYDQAGGGGPGALLSRAGSERDGEAYLSNLVFSESAQAVVPREVTAVRQALDGWGVTTAVLPDAAPLPEYARVDTVRSVIILMTAAVGRMPIRQAGAWVWPDIAHAGAPARPSATRLRDCDGPLTGTVASLTASAECVLARR